MWYKSQELVQTQIFFETLLEPSFSRTVAPFLGSCFGHAEEGVIVVTIRMQSRRSKRITWQR